VRILGYSLCRRAWLLNGTAIAGGPDPAPGDAFLLEDGVSFILLEDGTSKLLLEA